MTARAYRYQLESSLPGHKGSRHRCPGCDKSKQFTRYVDTRNGELLPDIYGICNHRDSCGYSLSPYTKTASGLSYADEVYNAYLENKPVTARTYIKRPTPQPIQLMPVTTKVCTIPAEVVTKSLQHYEHNTFAHLLWDRFGIGVGNELLQRFQIGTSVYWPGACIFWYVDEQQQARGGQVVLFDQQGHTAKRVDREGNKRRCTSWVHTALSVDYRKRNEPQPVWLTNYTNNAPKSPIPFGLHQIATTPSDQPVAIVEAPKTAVLCAACYPQFVWLAIGALDYLTIERVAPLRGRKIRLFPDASKTGNAFASWKAKAQQFNAEGFSISVDTILEQVVPLTDVQRANGYDMADFILDNWQGYPPDWDSSNLPNTTPITKV